MTRPYLVTIVGPPHNHGRGLAFDCYDTTAEAIAVGKALWRVRALCVFSKVNVTHRFGANTVLWEGTD